VDQAATLSYYCTSLHNPHLVKVIWVDSHKVVVHGVQNAILLRRMRDRALVRWIKTWPLVELSATTHKPAETKVSEIESMPLAKTHGGVVD